MALYAFDGTWNEQHDAGLYGVNTNVVEFANAYDGRRAVVQKPLEEGGTSVHDEFYYKGIGTRHGTLGKWLGGAFGFGGRKRIADAKSTIARRFAEGDETIDIIGFSRGAALALHFANTLKGDTFRNKIGQKVKPVVRFLGLWDTVAAFGIPINLGPLRFQRINLGYRLKLHQHVKYCFHAVAIDEQRSAFVVTRVNNGYQVWFRGVHSDVGGGNQNTLLSNITLSWMLRKAARVGLPIDPNFVDRLERDPRAGIRPATGLSGRRRFRELKERDRIHHTVSARNVAECQNPPKGCPVESESDERSRILTITELAKEHA